MSVNGNASLRIRATSAGDNTEFGQGGYYVQSVKINGVGWDKNWFEHEDVMVNGGSIEFELGDEPVVWESGDAPPSPGHLVL